MGISEREKKYQIMLSFKHHNFCYAEAYRCYSWLAGFSGEMVIDTFLLGFFSHSRQKEWYEC